MPDRSKNAAVQNCWFFLALLMTLLCGDIVALWSEPVGIQIDVLCYIGCHNNGLFIGCNKNNNKNAKYMHKN
jgi:hypothetical protein